MSTNNPEYQKEYDAKYSVQLKLRLSRKYDADILEHLGKVGNKQGYIKDLIREDMRRNGKMKLYYVTAIKGDDEFLVAKTADADEAVKIAREHWSHLEQADKKRNIIEIRDYAEDVEDENCTDFSYDTVKWRGVNEIRNREEVVDELTELIMQFERDHNPFQTDVYMYIGEDGNATLNTFINVGGNSWLDDDHITIYRDKPHYDDPIDEATIDACRGDFEQTAEEWIRYAEMDERKDREWR